MQRKFKYKLLSFLSNTNYGCPPLRGGEEGGRNTFSSPVLPSKGDNGCKLKLFFFLSLLIFSTITFGQNKYDYHWMLGYNYTDSLEGSEGSLINFNESPPSIKYMSFSPEISLGRQIVTMSDENTGDLLFYSNGCVVFDKSNNMMMNGDNLNPGNIHEEFCKNGLFFYPQGLGMLALPDISNANGYYLIHATIRDEGQLFNIRDTLRYSYIDMKGNNGLGEVTIKNQPIYDQWLDSGLNTCKHADGQSWWLINLHNESNTFAKFLLDDQGVTFQDTQSIGIAPTPRGYQGSFSPDGSLYAWYGGHHDLQLFDFDRETGDLSNYREIYVNDTLDHGGLSFSPSGRFIYCMTAKNIYQVDLQNPSGEEELIEVASLELPPPNSFSGTFGSAMLGPDCRIYITARNGIKYLTTIDYPDIKGLDCTVKQYDFELPFYNFILSIPNNPHYRIDEPFPCTYATSTQDTWISDKLLLSPNPTNNVLTIKESQNSAYVIYDIKGNVLLKGDLQSGTSEIDVSGLASGMYIIVCKENGRHAKFIKI